MASTFKRIGQKIDDFLDSKKYELHRTAVIRVPSDKINWALETKLNKDGGIESEFAVSHRFELERLSMLTSTTKAPEFELKSKRFEPNFDLKTSIQDPELEINLYHKRQKYALSVESTYDWSNQNCKAEIDATYAGIDSLLLGTKVKLERSQRQQTLGITDYNIGAQFKRNADQTFAVTTQNQLQMVKVGAEVKVRDSFKGFAKVSYNTALDAPDSIDSNPLGYSVGVQRDIDSNSSIRGVFRNNQTASVLYENKFKESNIFTKVAANFDFTKPPSQRANIQWRIQFGEIDFTK